MKLLHKTSPVRQTAALLIFLSGGGILPENVAEADPSYHYEVVIYGGTSAGVAAAVQAARMGRSVAIVCPETHLGGLSAGGLGWTDTGNKEVIGGIAREFYHRIWKHYERPEAWRWQPREAYGNAGQGTPAIDGDRRTMWIFEPHVAEQVCEDFVREAGLPVFRDEWLDRDQGLVKTGATIESLRTLSGQTFHGEVFIDATYEGDLLAAAGVSHHVGREASDVYGEKWNGVQLDARHHGHFFAKPTDPYVVPGDAASGLLPGISDEPPGSPGAGDRRVQAYCFRMCLSKHPENRVPFPRPADYDPRQYELLLRVFDTGWREFFAKFDPIPNLKTDTNNHGPFSTDNIGANYDYPEASYARRREILEEHKAYQQGLMYFVANDPRVPADVRQQMSQWGLAADEFVDNGNWPHQLYVREARRMVGDYVMTEADCLLERVTPRPVGMGSYVMDSHNVQRYVTADGTVQNEGDVGVRPPGPYAISYGSLVPRREEASNLLVPVCLSSSHIAYGSIRMEPVFMILGQSAATAACLALDAGKPVHDVDYETLRCRLVQDQQILQLGGDTPQVTPGSEGATAWQPLSFDPPFAAWQPGHNGWRVGGDAALDAASNRSLRSLPGRGVVISGGINSSNLVTCEQFVDVEVALDFMIGPGANSGVKLNGLYEIQIRDSADVARPIGNDCGGVYPRGENAPFYHVIDEGVPPRVNAARRAGEWQSLRIAFRSPRFDDNGKKLQEAEFVEVVLNDRVIHEGVKLKHPTGAAWRLSAEVPRGPILLQGDHGVVAFRNVRVRPLR